METDFRFQTKPLDGDIGQYYFVARQYDQSTGRFTGRDAHVAGKVRDYLFVKNQSTKLVDPVALMPGYPAGKHLQKRLAVEPKGTKEDFA